MKALKYWSKRLSGHPDRIKFLVTKSLEIITFKSHSGVDKTAYEYMEYPESIKNMVPENPIVAIVIPTYIRTSKDMDDIGRLIDTINMQTLKAREVFIIDDCSPVKVEFPADVNVHRFTENSGPAKARNKGKELALDHGADIVMFTDTDCRLSENWVEVVVDAFITNRRAQAFSGNTLSFDHSWFGKYHELNGTLNGRVFQDSDRLLYGTTANLAITSLVANQLDFNDKFRFAAGEDIEFCFRMNQAGYELHHEPGMQVQHHYGYTRNLFNNIKQFRSQFKRYAKGESTLLEEIPDYYEYFDKTNEIVASKA